jgi:hypothetical protein
MSKAEETKDYAIKELKRELAKVQSEFKELAEAVPLESIAESLEAKAEVLVEDKYRSNELMYDPDTLDDFIKELSSMLRTAKFLKKLLENKD